MRLIRYVIPLALLIVTRMASASPIVCSAGNEDSTCLPAIYGSAIPAPGCPAGWTQTSAPQWQGSHWSSPGCAAPAPPPVQPPPVTQSPDLFAICKAALRQWVSTQGWGNMRPGWMNLNSASPPGYTTASGMSGGLGAVLWSAQAGFASMATRDAMFTMWTGGPLGGTYEVIGGFDNGFDDQYTVPSCLINTSGTVLQLTAGRVTSACSGCSSGPGGGH